MAQVEQVQAQAKLTSLPPEILEKIIIEVEDPANLVVTCRDLYTLGKDPIVRSKWVIRQAGANQAFYHVIRLQESMFKNADAMNYIFACADEESRRVYREYHRQRLIRMCRLPGFSLEQLLDHASSIRTNYLLPEKFKKTKGKAKVYAHGSTLSPEKIEQILDNLPPAPPGIPRFLLQIAIKRSMASNKPEITMCLLKYGMEHYDDMKLNKCDLDVYRKYVSGNRYNQSWNPNPAQGQQVDAEVLAYIPTAVQAPSNLQSLIHWMSGSMIQANVGGGVGVVTNPTAIVSPGSHTLENGASIDVVELLTKIDQALGSSRNNNRNLDPLQALDQLFVILDELDQDVLNLRISTQEKDVAGYATLLGKENNGINRERLSSFLFLKSLPVRLRLLLVLMDVYGMGPNYSRVACSETATDLSLPNPLAPEGYKMLLNLVGNDNYLLLACMLRRGGSLYYQCPWALANQVIRGDGSFDNRTNIESTLRRIWNTRDRQPSPQFMESDDEGPMGMIHNHPALMALLQENQFNIFNQGHHNMSNQPLAVITNPNQDEVPNLPSNLALSMGVVPEGIARFVMPQLGRSQGPFNAQEYQDYRNLPKSLMDHAISSKKPKSFWIVLTAMFDWKTPSDIVQVDEEKLNPREKKRWNDLQQVLIKAYQRCVDEDWGDGRDILERFLTADRIQSIRQSPEAMSKGLREACRQGRLDRVRTLIEEGAKLSLVPPCGHTNANFRYRYNCNYCENGATSFITDLLNGPNDIQIISYLLSHVELNQKEIADIVLKIMERAPVHSINTILNVPNVQESLDERHIRAAIHRGSNGVVAKVLDLVVSAGVKTGKTFRGFPSILKMVKQRVVRQETTLIQLKMMKLLGAKAEPTVPNYLTRAQECLKVEKDTEETLKQYQTKVSKRKLEMDYDNFLKGKSKRQERVKRQREAQAQSEQESESEQGSMESEDEIEEIESEEFGSERDEGVDVESSEDELENSGPAIRNRSPEV